MFGMGETDDGLEVKPGEGAIMNIGWAKIASSQIACNLSKIDLKGVNTSTWIVHPLSILFTSSENNDYKLRPSWHGLCRFPN